MKTHSGVEAEDSCEQYESLQIMRESTVLTTRNRYVTKKIKLLKSHQMRYHEKGNGMRKIMIPTLSKSVKY